MNLKSLAKKAEILDGKATVWMLPYRTRKAGYVYDEIAALFENDVADWDDYQAVFIWVEQYLVEIDIADPGGAHVKGLQLYLDTRKKGLKKAWEVFSNTVSRDVLYALHQAYLDTREDLPKAPEILTEGRPNQSADPEDSSAGGKKS
jgi:hypothetical protein